MNTAATNAGTEEDRVRAIVRSVLNDELEDLPIADIRVRSGVDHYDGKIFWIDVVYAGEGRLIDSDRTLTVLRGVTSRLMDLAVGEEDFGFPILSWVAEESVRRREAEAV